MASGEKLPNTNLNLIQDIDMIDHADINAIAQAAEANSANIGRMQLKNPIKYLGGTLTDLDTTLEFEFLGYFTNGPSELTGYIYFNQQFYTSVSVGSSRRQFAQSYTNGRMFTRVKHSGQPFSPWREIGYQISFGSLANGTDLHTLKRGTYALGGSGVYVNGVATMYGVLEVKEIGTNKYMTFHNFNNTYWVKAYSDTAWSAWKNITGT